MDEQELLSSEAAREFLSVSRTTMHRLVQNGEVRRLKVGGQWRFQKADLLAHLERKPVAIAAKSLPELDAELAWWRRETAASTAEEPTSPEEKIAALVNAILTLALQRQASDVHLEPGVGAARIRFRFDGALETVREMPVGVFVPVVSGFKEMCQMSIEDARVQDGRILLSREGRDFDLRLTTCPTTRGESLSIGVLFSGEQPGLDALGLDEEQLAQIKSLLERPQGLILLCGPSGSGKGTLFYALLDFLAGESVKIVTLEDPVEASLRGACQTNVQRRTGLTFSAGLRTFLRCDPDIIGVGDLPDLETVELAVQGALSGHLVIAQSGAPDVSRALLQLDEMGLEPFLLGAAVQGATAQRLVRRVCPDCARDVELSPPLLARLSAIVAREEIEIPGDAKWKRGAGCAKCRQSGYRGRIALFEVVTMSEPLREAIMQGTAIEVARIARASGAKTLWQVGLERAARGETTPDELLRALSF